MAMDPPTDAETLLDLTREKLVVLDEEGRYRYLNAATQEVLGFEPEELVGEDALSFVHPEDEARLRTVFTEVVAGERDKMETLEYRYATADGDWVWLQSEFYVPEQTGLDGYVLSSRDITEEIESIRRLETIVSTSTDVLWMFDAEWSELLFVSGAVKDVFGIDPATLKRRPTRFLEQVHPADRSHVECAMRRLSAGEATNIDYRVEPGDGGVRWVRVPGEPVYEDGDIVAVAGFARDVTDEYRRNRQLEVMDNLMRHTIRNDMNVVIGTADDMIESLDERSDTSDRRAGTDALGLRSDAETIRRVAEELLDTAEKQRDVIELLSRGGSPRPIEVESVVRDPVDAARAEAPDAEFTVSCPEDATAFALPELEYAITELIENAVEHADDSPVVRVDATHTAEEIWITVRDNCPPIPVEERQVIADHREMDALRHTNGMGLWLAYWVAERSDGDVTFTAGENGNVVRVTVPRHGVETSPDPA